MSVVFDDYEEDYYRRRPSWREIDRMKDRSGFSRVKEKRERESSLKKVERSSWLKEKYLKEVEKLFSGKKKSPDQQKALKRLQNAYGTKRFQKVAKEYVKEYGMPEDWNTLILLLEAGDDEIVCEAIEVLAKSFQEKGPIEQQGFQAKLRTLSMVSESELVKRTAKRVLEELEAV